MTHATRPWALAARTLDAVAAGRRLALAAEAGFRHVGVLVNPDTWTGEDTKTLRGGLAQAGVEVLDVEAIRLTGDPNVASATRTLDVAAELGAQYVLVIGHDTNRARVIDDFARVCELAAERGLRAAIEFMPFRAVANLADAQELVRGAGSAAGCLVVDNHHLARSGGSVAALAQLPRATLGYAQLCDVDAADLDAVLPVEALMHEALNRRLAPGAGTLPCAEFIRALPDSTPVSIEILGPHLRERYPDDRSYLMALRHAVDRLG